jgi:hypothetical protein
MRGGTFTITTDGGRITNNKAGSRGGGVYIVNDSGTMFIMDGGAISDNTAGGDGGGVYVDGEGVEFEMRYDAAISKNTASGNGGGVFFKGIFNMQRGTISENKAGSKEINSDSSSGGGVYVEGIFTMHNGSIINNKMNGKNDNGGGVAVRDGGIFIMNGGSISGNAIWPEGEDGENAGDGKGIGVYVAGVAGNEGGGKFTKTGGVIHGLDNGSGWETGPQNYYKWVVHTETGYEHYIPYKGGKGYDDPKHPGYPNGKGRGYAVYFDHYNEGEPDPWYCDKTISVPLSTADYGEETWSGEDGG